MVLYLEKDLKKTLLVDMGVGELQLMCYWEVEKGVILEI